MVGVRYSVDSRCELLLGPVEYWENGCIPEGLLLVFLIINNNNAHCVILVQWTEQKTLLSYLKPVNDKTVIKLRMTRTSY